MEIGLLISGNLGLIILKELIESKHSLSFVFSDSGSEEIIKTCVNYKIPCFRGNPRNHRAKDFLEKIPTPKLLLSVNYLFIIEDDVIAKTESYAVNIHGSLLPKFRGRTPHVWAIINGEKQTGITGHIITKSCDEGDIIYQEIVSIGDDDTGYQILRKFNNRYPVIVHRIISKIEKNEVKLIPQNDNEATYFGKRTQTDGLINWNWQKERIKNWVRAQANPYPGAFTFYERNKIIIHKIEFCDKGFHYNDINGKILSVDGGLIVKTPNGAVKIIECSWDHSLDFIAGKIFNNGY